MTYRVAIYQTKESGQLLWITLGLGESNLERYGKTALKLQREMSHALRSTIATKTATEASQFFAPRGLELKRVHLALSLKDAERRKVSGRASSACPCSSSTVSASGETTGSTSCEKRYWQGERARPPGVLLASEELPRSNYTRTRAMEVPRSDSLRGSNRRY